MKTIKTMVLASAVMLTACGGGGGGSGIATTPAVSPSARTLITTLLGASTTNVVVSREDLGTSTATVDMYFQSNQNILDSLDTTYVKGFAAFNRKIQGPRANAPSLVVPNPPLDVRQAWFDGWTGKGANILIMDDFLAFGDPLASNDPINRQGVHGYTVFMSANQIAPGATFYGLEAEISTGKDSPALTKYRDGELRLASTNQRIQLTGMIPTIHVVNQSFGEEPIASGITAAELEHEFGEEHASKDPRFMDIAGTAGTSLSMALADAVITKSAGNNARTDAAFSIGNLRLISTRAPNTRNRALIVGALDKFARTGSNARMASYSSFAGQFTQMQERFLVEYGGTPYAENAYLCDASSTASCRTLGSGSGTSYAAPRVAGFAALVRGKFPILSGKQTAKILLDTATTMGLACHTGSARKSTNCEKHIYGQGRVDIADALSPIGKLN